MTEDPPRPVRGIGRDRARQYRLLFRPAALRSLRKLDRKAAERIKIATEALRDDPWPPDAKKLTGLDGLFRIRVGDYRILYIVDDDDAVVRVVLAGHRRDVYRNIYRGLGR